MDDGRRSFARFARYRAHNGHLGLAARRRSVRAFGRVGSCPAAAEKKLSDSGQRYAADRNQDAAYLYVNNSAVTIRVRDGERERERDSNQSVIS